MTRAAADAVFGRCANTIVTDDPYNASSGGPAQPSPQPARALGSIVAEMLAFLAVLRQAGQPPVGCEGLGDEESMA